MSPFPSTKLCPRTVAGWPGWDVDRYKTSQCRRCNPSSQNGHDDFPEMTSKITCDHRHIQLYSLPPLEPHPASVYINPCHAGTAGRPSGFHAALTVMMHQQLWSHFIHYEALGPATVQLCAAQVAPHLGVTWSHQGWMNISWCLIIRWYLMWVLGLY